MAQAALSGEATLVNSNPGQPAQPLRILTAPLEINGQIVGVLQVGASLYHLYLTMRSMLTLLMVGVLGTMLVGGIGIWFLARRALRPLENIASTAEYIGSSQDLSQRLQIRGPNDEVGRLSRAFNAMIGRLDAAFAAQKQFIADSSHELRTPLTVIRGNLDIMKRDDSVESRRESLAAMDQESARMGKIVEDLMLLAQIDGAHTPRCDRVPLDEVVLQVYNQSRVLAADKQVVLGHVDAVTVLADHDRLVQMLLNLVDNAIKYTPAGGVITIECRAPSMQTAGFATLSVRDTGIGIAPEHLPHIFDRFYRVDKARSRAQGGTGLGLAIVQSIAEAYGGRVTVESTLGQGSTFTVILPAAQTDSKGVRDP
jgi:heavy metal sensor kinase